MGRGWLMTKQAKTPFTWIKMNCPENINSTPALAKKAIAPEAGPLFKLHQALC
jgi:hypothetical protein